MARSEVTDQGLTVTDGDHYPKDEDAHASLISWANQAFTAAENARRPFEERWSRYYKMYRSFVQRVEGDWRSKVFIPQVFTIIETILPRLVAQLPKFITRPLRQDSVEAAKDMEELLDYARTSANPDLYVEKVKQMKDALMYGTGILKTRYVTDKKIGHRWVEDLQPVTKQVDQPVIDPVSGEEVTDPETGNVITERVELSLGEVKVGYKRENYTYVAYEGPVAEWVDLWSFYPAPDAVDIETARYVIHRTFQPLSHIKRLIKRGTYRLFEADTDDLGASADVSDEAIAKRLGLIDKGGAINDSTRKVVEIWEIWTDSGRVLTIANRSHVLRYSDNPFDHGEKPFARTVDHIVPGVFWGIGEVEYLEGPQDLTNSLVNQRIDNTRLSTNLMMVVNEGAVEMDDLVFRPGGVIRVNGQNLPADVINFPDMPDVTSGAFNEAEYMERLFDKASGVSGYQMGADSPGDQNTATGVIAMQEAGATRFGLKVRLDELTGNKVVARQFGSMIQQFMSEERELMILGPDGWEPRVYDPARLHGAIDYDIEAASQVQTEGARRQEAIQNLQILPSYMRPDPMTGGPGPGVDALVEDVLRSQGKKDIMRYMPPQVPIDPATGMPLEQGGPIDPETGLPVEDVPGIGDPGGRQAFGGVQPPGALPVGQNFAFGPRGTDPAQALARELMRVNTEGGVDQLVGR